MQIPKIGQRIRAIIPIDRFPDFILPVGVTGTVESIDKNLAFVRMDEHHPELNEWDNVLHVPGDADPSGDLATLLWSEFELIE